MRVLVTGVKGQLGHDVENEMEKRGLTPVGVDLAEMDITDKEACDRVITEANVEASSTVPLIQRLTRRRTISRCAGRSTQAEQEISRKSAKSSASR